MNPRLIHSVLTLVAVALASTTSVTAAAPTEPVAIHQQERTETTRLIAAELPNWKLWRGAKRDAALQVSPKSLLRWTNPGTGRVNGDLYVWTENGRPEAVMSLFKAWEPANGFHAEFHSLSLQPIEAVREGKVLWNPQEPGVKFDDVPEAASPANTATARLVQMRMLAGEFTAELTDFRQNNKGDRQSLRLLTQPLYRYPSPTAELMDGALFAFTLGTDPEVFLLLEARQTTTDPRWQYGFARMNSDSMAAFHKDREVWRSERNAKPDPLRNPYILARVPETP